MQFNKKITATVFSAIVAAGLIGGTTAAMAAGNTPAAHSSAVSVPAAVANSDAEVNDINEVDATGAAEDASEGTETGTEATGAAEVNEVNDGADLGSDMNPNEPGHQDTEVNDTK